MPLEAPDQVWEEKAQGGLRACLEGLSEAQGSSGSPHVTRAQGGCSLTHGASRNHGLIPSSTSSVRVLRLWVEVEIPSLGDLGVAWCSGNSKGFGVRPGFDSWLYGENS